MCSSPKGSSQCFRQTKKKEFSHSEYEEYASMMRRASAVYDRIEKEKAERRQAMANQHAEVDIEIKKCLKNEGNVQTGRFSSIKNIFITAYFLGRKMIQLITEDQATGKTKEVYEDIKNHHGY